VNSILILIHLCWLCSIIFHSIEEIHFHLCFHEFSLLHLFLCVFVLKLFTLGLSLPGSVCVTVFILVSFNYQITVLLGQSAEMVILYTRGANIFQRGRSHLKIPGT